MSYSSALAAAPAPSAWQSPGTALLTVGVGLLFTVIGFLMWTDYKGARRWVMADDGPAVLRRLNIKFSFRGDEDRYKHHMATVFPRILGCGFMVIGGIPLLVGLVSLLVLAF
jgi:uncharacterized membrane protein YphA (DoxX/SURF4 family)